MWKVLSLYEAWPPGHRWLVVSNGFCFPMGSWGLRSYSFDSYIPENCPWIFKECFQVSKDPHPLSEALLLINTQQMIAINIIVFIKQGLILLASVSQAGALNMWVFCFVFREWHDKYLKAQHNAMLSSNMSPQTSFLPILQQWYEVWLSTTMPFYSDYCCCSLGEIDVKKLNSLTWSHNNCET